jgi:hypothetical protein
MVTLDNMSTTSATTASIHATTVTMWRCAQDVVDVSTTHTTSDDLFTTTPTNNDGDTSNSDGDSTTGPPVVVDSHLLPDMDVDDAGAAARSTRPFRIQFGEHRSADAWGVLYKQVGACAAAATAAGIWLTVANESMSTLWFPLGAACAVTVGVGAAHTLGDRCAAELAAARMRHAADPHQVDATGGVPHPYMW